MADLDALVVVNESHDEAVAGDVSVFRNVDAACGWLESWWVENGEGTALTASGDRLVLGVDERDRVVLLRREVIPDGPTLVHNLLCTAATAVLEARRGKTATGKVSLNAFEQEGRLPTSVEELCAYVGFTG
jgi:hypothetical protein